MAAHSRNLTEGPVWRALASVSVPMSVGIFAVLSVGLADAYFLGRLGGEPLAAVGYIVPVITAITSLSIGLSAGANAAVSQAIGRGDGEEDERRLALHAIGLGLVLSVLVAAAVWAAQGPLFSALGASASVMEEIRLYVPWWAASFPFLVVAMLITAVFRAHGSGTTAAVLMAAQAIVNVCITPVFIYGLGPAPEMGTGGAAFATFLARVAMMAAAVVWALRTGVVRLDCGPWRDLRKSLVEITKVGAPAAFSNAINPAGMAAVTAAVATVGTAAVAGFGAATRVQSLAIVPLMALSAGIGPVVGQNWGADKPERAATALHLAVGFCLGYGALVAVVLWTFAEPLALAIASSEEPADYTADYLRLVGLSLFGYGILVVSNAAVNARSKALWSMGLSLARNLAVYLPGAWAGVAVLGYTGILWAAVAANLFGALGGVWIGWRNGLWRVGLPERAPAPA